MITTWLPLLLLALAGSAVLLIRLIYVVGDWLEGGALSGFWYWIEDHPWVSTGIGVVLVAGLWTGFAFAAGVES